MPQPAPSTVAGPSRYATVLKIVGALVVIAAVAVAGVYFVKNRNASAEVPDATAPETNATVAAGPVGPPPPAAPPACAEGDALVANMSRRDKLAQLLMVGVTGAADARAAVADQRVGGIMIGSWTDLSMLGGPLADIASSAGPLPLAVSVDEEGGRVSRLASIIGRQQSARVLAQSASPDEVYAIALERGRAMRDLGITIDFAPVADVSSQADDTVIGDRAFSDDPQTVVEYAGAYARGLSDAGLTPVLKHFPGHGQASGDSHQGGVVTPSLSVLMNDDLVPYRALITQPGVAVMVGHMQVPELTGSDPASLSTAAYGLLRTGGYGGQPFDGVVFTDDLSSMGAINQRYGVPEAVLKSLQAGADIGLWITTDEVPAVLDRLEDAVDAGQLSMDDVDRSVLRIAGLKGKSPLCRG